MPLNVVRASTFSDTGGVSSGNKRPVTHFRLLEWVQYHRESLGFKDLEKRGSAGQELQIFERGHYFLKRVFGVAEHHERSVAKEELILHAGVPGAE